ncbi:MAG TPA: alkaline phosphatase PhoX [Ideonella sp.]|uniref:alkaline phosphatase PhoX n=1 Tax=Ideonella sp. TaxID=1929293 RepID=UPI002CF668EC|nr:alkaline phosphatase PhoX [Ideonella sp.]HSI49735.1 alkaline phosphatase PhoX [Ideonella sp.]
MTAVSLAHILSACGGGDDDGRDDSYGPLSAQNGTISLPEGFRYVELAAAGSLMSDGRTMPGAHDGMTCFAGPDGTLLLLRNYELSSSDALVDDTRFYDGLGAGGVTVTVFDPASEKAVKSFAALLGTIENCNGGTSLSGAWLSCEETTDGIGAGYTQPHGYVFEVPATTTALIETPVPLKAMGRFEHEAARQDASTGVVYMTEDNGDPADGFYRFVPADKMDLSQGGQLQMLAVKGRPQLVLYRGQTVGVEYKTEWVDIADPDPVDAEDEPAAVFLQGLALGGAQFMGLEGMALQDGVAYFVGSEAGDKEFGQVWSFTPDGDGGTLKLLYESTDGSVLDQPDNITVSPNGAVVMCEDGDGEDEGGDNWLRVLTPKGKVFDFAQNIKQIDLNLVDDEDYPEPGKSFGVSEFSGVCFSPDGKWMFLNVQYPGLTLAITGPWERGVL